MKIVELMITNGACDWDGGLHSACENGHVDIAKLMIKNGANRFDHSEIENSDNISDNIHSDMSIDQIKHIILLQLEHGASPDIFPDDLLIELLNLNTQLISSVSLPLQHDFIHKLTQKRKIRQQCNKWLLCNCMVDDVISLINIFIMFQSQVIM